MPLQRNLLQVSQLPLLNRPRRLWNHSPVAEPVEVGEETESRQKQNTATPEVLSGSIATTELLEKGNGSSGRK